MLLSTARFVPFAFAFAFTFSSQSLSALTIQLDYSLDTNGFFDSQESRNAMQAVADRWGAIITQELSEVATADDNQDVRIGFTHPGTGASYQISSAAGQATDRLIGSSIADEYRDGIEIPADTIIIFAGGRDISSAGQGGTGTGVNFTSVFNDPEGIHNRGFNVGFGSQPVWGGAVTFDTGRNWNFALEAPFTSGSDFYTIALHEVGHVLGLSVGFDDFEDLIVGDSFIGANAEMGVLGGAPGGLLVEDPTLIPRSETTSDVANPHWQDGTYQSVIFAGGNPNYAMTVGEGQPQDLAMEPIANFTSQIRRIELTRADIGALQDIGYAVISEFGSTTPLELWRETFFGTTASAGDALDALDFDSDGLPNLLEYALGTNPIEPEFEVVSGLESSVGSLALRFSFDPTAEGVNLIVEAGDDLQNWNPIAETMGLGTFTVVEAGTMISQEGDETVVGSSNLISSTLREFLRLRVVEIVN